MKMLYWVLLGVAALPAVSCSMDSGGSSNYYQLGDEQAFNVINFRVNKYDSVRARMVAENDVCMVYVELSGKNLTVDTVEAQKIAAEYKANIHSQITGAFGSIKHLTANNKVTFLLVDIQDFYPTRESSTAGYFSPDDMLSKSVNPYSNERDMLFIDTNPGLKYPDSLYATMAHELQHLINFSQTTRVNGGRDMDIWVNEGLSTSAEYIYGKGTASYVKYYSDEKYNTSIRYGNNFFVWNGAWENGAFTNGGVKIYDAFGNYSTAYLFFQWLRIHAGTRRIYNDIIAYGAQGFTDYRSVTKAAYYRWTIGVGMSGDTDWETLLRTWLVANLVQADSGFFGYKGQIGDISEGAVDSLTPGFASQALDGNKWEKFHPGEGIFSEIDSGTYTPPSGSGGHIKYVGIGEAGIDTGTSGSYAGEVLLTFNANADNTVVSGGYLTNFETGYLARAQLPRARMRSSLRGLARETIGSGGGSDGYTPQVRELVDTGFMNRPKAPAVTTPIALP